jgi:glycosyltransferase involved in cell wall biosynthesis
MLRPLLMLCERMTVVGPEVADYFTGTIGVPRERVTIVPNGVDIGAFDCDRESARRDLGLDSRELVLGTVGRLEPEKDQTTLLDVFGQVRARHPRARLLVVGDGSLAESLRAYARQIGVADHTLFLGYRRDIAKLLAAMDVFVLTSIREGLPISLIEAMAARRPVIASDIGSVNDLVRNGENGLVVQAGNAAGFAGAVERLIGSPELCERLGQAGRRTVEASYSLAAVIRTYEELYRSAAVKAHVRN